MGFVQQSPQVRLPRLTSLFSVARRVLSNYGKVRIAMAEGCPETFPDREFLFYIWGFERKSTPAFVSKIERYGLNVPVTVLKSRKESALLIRES